MSNLWTPSDEMLQRDPIAQRMIQSPFEPLDLEAEGIQLFDVEDDDANEAAACLVLASLDDDSTAADEPGECDDDEQIDEPDDGENLMGEV
jgi:hypothetical protein